MVTTRAARAAAARQAAARPAEPASESDSHDSHNTSPLVTHCRSTRIRRAIRATAERHSSPTPDAVPQQPALSPTASSPAQEHPAPHSSPSHTPEPKHKPSGIEGSEGMQLGRPAPVPHHDPVVLPRAPSTISSSSSPTTQTQTTPATTKPSSRSSATSATIDLTQKAEPTAINLAAEPTRERHDPKDTLSRSTSMRQRATTTRRAVPRGTEATTRDTASRTARTTTAARDANHQRTTSTTQPAMTITRPQRTTSGAPATLAATRHQRATSGTQSTASTATRHQPSSSTSGATAPPRSTSLRAAVTARSVASAGSGTRTEVAPGPGADSRQPSSSLRTTSTSARSAACSRTTSTSASLATGSSTRPAASTASTRTESTTKQDANQPATAPMLDVSAACKTLQASITLSKGCTPVNCTAPLLSLLGFTLPNGGGSGTALGFSLLQATRELPTYNVVLPANNQVYLAKTTINTVLATLSEAARSPSSIPSSTPRVRPVATRPALTNPQKLVNVPVMIDTFKVALQFLLNHRRTDSNTHRTELEGTMYSLLRKLHALGLTTHVLRESIVMFHLLAHDNLSLAMDVPSLTAALTPAQVPMGEDQVRHAELLALNLQVAALAASAALSTPTTESQVDHLVRLLSNDTTGPRALQLQTRAFVSDHRPTEPGEQAVEQELAKHKRWTEVETCLDRAMAQFERGVDEAVERMAKADQVPKTAPCILELRSVVLSVRLCKANLDPKTYWSRAARTAVTWAEGRSLTENVDGHEAYLHAHRMLASLAQLGRECGQLPQDVQAWGQLFELWTYIAKKTGSTEPYMVIEELSSRSVPVQTQQDVAEVKQDVGPLLTRLASASTVIDNWIKAVRAPGQAPAPTHEQVNAALTQATNMAGLALNISTNDQQVVNEALRALDRLRRRTSWLLQWLSTDLTARQLYLTKVEQLALVILQTYRKAVVAGTPPDGSMLLDMPDFAARILHGRVAGSTSSPTVGTNDDPAQFVHLCERAFKQCERLTRPMEEGKEPPATQWGALTELEFLLDLSKWIYYPGRHLYNSNNAADAKPFFRLSCELGAKAVALASKLEAEGTKLPAGLMQKVVEVRGQPGTVPGLTRKYEALAVCHRFLHDARAAIEAYVQAVRLTMSQMWTQLATAANFKPLDTLFADVQFNHLGVLVRTIIELATCDLLTSSDEDEFNLVAVLEPGEDAKRQTAVSALVEHAAMSLLPLCSRQIHASACSTLLRQAADLLGASRDPARLARIKLIQAELALMVRDRESVRTLLAEAVPLLERAQRGVAKDELGLASYAATALARSELLAIIGRVDLDPDPNGQLWQRVQRIANWLFPLLKQPTPPRSEESTASQASSAPLQPVQPTASQQGMVTPPRKKPTASVRTKLPATDKNPSGGTRAPSSGTTTAVPVTPRIEDPKRLAITLETAIETAGAAGHTMAVVQLLQLNLALYQLIDSSAQRTSPSEDVLRTAVELAREYLHLGSPIGAELLGWVLQNPLYPSVRLNSYLVNAEVLMQHAQGGNQAQRECLTAALKAFDTVSNLADFAPGNPRPTAWEKFSARTMSQEAVARAGETLATVAYDAGDLTVASQACLGAFKATMRLASGLQRYASWNPEVHEEDVLGKSKENQSEAKPEAGNIAKSTTATLPVTVKRTNALIDPITTSTTAFTEQSYTAPVTMEFLGTYWRMVRRLLGLSRRQAQFHALEGAGKKAQLWAAQAVELSEFFGSQSYSSSASVVLSKEVDVLRKTGTLDELWTTKVQLPVFPTVWDVTLTLLSGQVNMVEDVFVSYGQRLDAHDALFNSLKDPSSQPCASATSSSPSTRTMHRRCASVLPANHPIWPELRGRLLRQRAALAYTKGDHEHVSQLFEQSSALDNSAENVYTQSLLLALGGLARLDKEVQQKEPNLDVLRTTVAQLPPILTTPGQTTAALRTQGSKLRALSAPLPEVMKQLQILQTHKAGGTVHALTQRDAAMLSALTAIKQGSLGAPTYTLVNQAIGSLAASCSVHIDSEYLAALRYKVDPSARLPEAGSWWTTTYPSLKQTLLAGAPTVPPTRKLTTGPMARSASPSRPSRNNVKKGKTLFMDNVSSSDDEDDLDRGGSKQLWEEAHDKLRLVITGETDPAAVVEEVKDLLPSNWTVISVARHPTEEHLVLSRFGGDAPSVMWDVPINRVETQSFDALLAEVASVTKESNEQVRNLTARYSGDGVEGRRRWWSDRRALESRLGKALDTVENEWLGCFKSVFAAPRHLTEEDRDNVRAGLESVLRDLFQQGAQRVKVDGALLDMFARLRNPSDVVLEEMLRLFASAYQLAGASLDQVDWKRGVTEVRSVLAEAWDAEPIQTPTPHTFLVLDRHLHALPWESLPVMREQSITRIPSLSLLRDRIKWAEANSLPRTPDGTYIIEPSKAYYLLNPSGDLKRSEERFGPWLQSRATTTELHWSGLMGQAPMGETLLGELERADLFLYFGHGSGEQYLGSSSMLRRLSRCAVAMLWGCSSGELHDQGHFDATGLPHDYLMAGSPALLATMWDLTDKELDNVAEATYLKLGLLSEDNLVAADPKSAYQGVNARRDPKSYGTYSLPLAVAHSRAYCRLPLMTGSAVVLYGLPVRFSAP